MSETPHVIADQIISDQAAAKRAAMLAGLTPEQRAAVEAATDALVKRALADVPMVQAIPGNAVATLETQEPATPGAATSEGKRSLAQQILGAVLALAGSIVAMLTASKPENPILPIVSALIAGIGGLIGGHAQSVYTKARSALKIGAQQ